MSQDIASLGIAVDATQAKTASKTLDELALSGGKAEQSTHSLANATAILSKVYGDLAKAAVAWKAYDYIKDATLLNARYETLGISMTQVGKNAGYTAEQMEAARLQGEQDAIKRLGTMSVEPEQVAARWPSVPGSHHYAGAGKCPPNSFGPDSEDLFTRNQLTTALAAARVAAINTCADEADRLEWDVCAFALRALIGTKT